MPSILLGGRRIDYTVVRGTGRRYTYLRFAPGPVLEVVVPRGVKVDVEGTIRKKLPWIVGRLDLLSRGQVLDGEGVMFEGSRMGIVFERTTGAERLTVDRAAGRVMVSASDRKVIPELVRRWFLQESSAYVVRALPRLAGVAGVSYRGADVREIRNWGYCTRTGRLSFSWQIIALPEDLREYILLHELAHLSHFDHSPAFKRRLGSVCPDFRRRERELAGIVPYDRLTMH